MKSGIYWIPGNQEGKIGIMPRPRGGDWLEDEIRAWRDDGADLVVSLLEPAEVRELEVEAEQSLCLQAGLDFISFPIPDQGVPRNRSEVVQFVERLKTSVLAGYGVAIHCRAGIGRAPMIAAVVLLSLGVSSKNVFQLISDARGFEVPQTREQEQYALTFWFGAGTSLS